jgi:hypothetical protein
MIILSIKTYFFKLIQENILGKRIKDINVIKY